MNVSTTIPADRADPSWAPARPVRGVAALAAAVTWLVLGLAGETGGDVRTSASRSRGPPHPRDVRHRTRPSLEPRPIPGDRTSSARERAQNGRVVR